MPRVAFLDTNIFLHCQPLREIPWRDVLHTDEVVLIATRVVVAELDEQKDTNTKQTLRDRARRVLHDIESWATPMAIRDDVTAIYYGRSPAIDYATYELRQDRSDDVLIATILQYQSENRASDVVLVTNDTGPRLTARYVGIAAVDLPDQYRLAGQADPLEEENRRLRAEAQKLQRAYPAPRVRFANDANRLTFKVRDEEPFDEAAVAAQLSELRKEHRLMFPPSDLSNISGILSETAMGLPPRHEYDRYNAELADYFQNYEPRMREQWARRQADRWTIELPFSLHNDGGAPAVDMDVEIAIRVRGTLLTFDPRYDRLVPPPSPREPQSQFDLTRFSVTQDLYRSSNVSDIVNRMHRNVSDAEVESEEDHHRITWSVKHLKHGYRIDFEPLYFVFASRGDARSLSVDWSVHAGNYPEPVTGKLHVIVQ